MLLTLLSPSRIGRVTSLGVFILCVEEESEWNIILSLVIVLHVLVYVSFLAVYLGSLIPLFQYNLLLRHSQHNLSHGMVYSEDACNLIGTEASIDKTSLIIIELNSLI